jgi:hypothetical protein
VVRHPQLLGQTLPCPKCQGQIVVPLAPPIGNESRQLGGVNDPNSAANTPIGSPDVTKRTGPSIVNSAAITKAGDPDWDELLASKNFSTPADYDHDSAQRFRPLGELGALQTESQPTSAPLVPVSSRTPIHNQSWQSENAAKRRQILMLTTIAATGSLLAIVCFVAFMRWMGASSDRNLVAIENQSDPSKAAQAGTVEPTRTDTTLPDNTKSEPPVETEGQSDTSGIEKPSEGDTFPTMPASVDKEKSPTQIEPAPQQPSPAAQPAVAESPVADAENVDPLPDFFTKGVLGDILNKSKRADAGFGSGEALDELDVQNATIDIGPVYHPPAKTIPNWDERSKLPISSFKIKDTSLLRCIDWFGRTTGIGVTVDWQSCRVAGIDVTKKVQIEATEKTVAELFASVIESHGLEWRLDTQGLPIVSAPRAAMEDKLPRDWSMAGIFPDGFEQEGCKTLLQLWGYEDICGFSDGRLLWNERATPVHKANVLASLLELARLRNSGQPRPVLGTSPANAIFSPNLWHSVLDRLNTKVGKSVVIPEPRPIPDLMMLAAAESGLNVYLDWQNVWNHGLVPNESAVLFMPGRTPMQIANRFLTNYSLEMIPVSEDSIWITTGDVRRKLIRVVPIQLAKDLKLDDLKQALLLLAPLGPDDRTRYRIVKLPGTEDLFFARLCTPKADQINDPDLELSFGWTKK